MKQRTKIVGALLFILVGIAAAVRDEIAHYLIDRAWPYAREWISDLDDEKARQAKADYDCEEVRVPAVASAKADLRKLKQAYNDCHERHCLEPFGEAMCAGEEKAVLAVQGRLNAVKADPCKAPA
jgi:hypothetical protein